MLDLRPCARIKNVFVDLVGETEGVELATESADEFHFFASENFAGWVVGIADDDRPGLGAERLAQLFRVEAPVGGHQRNHDRGGARDRAVSVQAPYRSSTTPVAT